MWKTLKLIDIVNIEIGKTPSRKNPKFWDKNKTGSNIWLSIRDMSNNNGLYIDDSREYISDEGAKLFKEVSKNTLIMSFKLSIGKLAITKKNLRTNEAIAAFKIKDTNLVSNKYLYYFLSSINWDKLAGYDIKVKGKTLNKAKLKEILITFPTIEEQQRLVIKLDAINSEIDRQTRLIEKKYKNISNFLNQYLATLKGDKIKLDDLVQIKTGKLDANAMVDGGKYPFFTCSKKVFNIDDFAFDCEAVLLAGNNASGDFNVKHYKGKFNAYQRTYILTIKDVTKLRPRYLYFQLIQALSKFKAISVGANTKFLKLGMIKNFEIILPSLKQQDALLKKLEIIEQNLNLLDRNTSLQKSNYYQLKSTIFKEEFKQRKIV